MNINTHINRFTLIYRWIYINTLMNLYQYVDEFILINSGYNILAFIALSYYEKSSSESVWQSMDLMLTLSYSFFSLLFI